MNNIQGFRVLVIKTLAIVGFIATAVLIVWLAVQGLKQLPAAFSSLASIAETVREYRPLKDLTLATEKTVINSGESLVLSWTDMKETDGAYTLSYACSPGVSLEVRTHEGTLTSLTCAEILHLRKDVQTLTVNVISTEARFVDVPVTLTFTSERTDTTKESTAKVTVVNASVPSGVLVDVLEIPEVSVPTPVVAVAEEKPVETPIVSTPTPVRVYPTSNPYGFTDLSITTVGIGTIEHGVFTYTGAYDRDDRSVIKFEVKNIGTKTSNTWLFRSILPNGDIYTSPIQPALMPGERIEFTLAFDFEDDSRRDDFVKITNTLSISEDINLKNNESVWHIPVID